MEVKLSIPTSLNEITLGQYQEFSKLDITKESEVQSKMIEIFCKVPVEVVRSMKAKDITDICVIINNMFDTEHQLINRFQMNGKDYGFIPDLENMSFGEYVDLDTFIGDWDKMEKAMNVLYRPILVSLKDKYSIEDYNIDTSEDLIDMPMDAVLGAIFFFWNLGIDLSTVMMNSLEGEQAQALMEQQTLEENGVGIKASMDYLKGILDDLKILPN